MDRICNENYFIEALLAPKVHPSIPVDKDFFGSLIGAWEIVWSDSFGNGGERHVKGEWIFERVLEGMAVQDIFICPSRAERERNPQPDGEYGTTLRIYNPRSEAWDIFYGCQGTAQQLEARREGDCIVLTDVPDGRIKFIFSDISEDSFHWQRIESEDRISWHIVGDVRATRLKKW